jgi:hypothetical protein
MESRRVGRLASLDTRVRFPRRVGSGILPTHVCATRCVLLTLDVLARRKPSKILGRPIHHLIIVRVKL